LALDGMARRTRGVSKIRPFRDGLKFLTILVRLAVLFEPVRVFVPPGLFLFLSGAALLIYQAIFLGKLEELPILLVLIYKVVGERVGLRIEGVNSPGHFLARIEVDGSWHLIDPFFHGQLLTTPEALARLAEMSGRPLEGLERYLTTASHVQWISRILHNLKGVYTAEDRPNDLAAMTELDKLLHQAQ
jgi:hypothetical protein